MNEIEKAIEQYSDFIKFCEETKQNFDLTYDKLALRALQAQAERSKMRCENCKQNIPEPDSPEDGLCDIKRLFDFKDTDYCSYFEPKENENG